MSVIMIEPVDFYCPVCESVLRTTTCQAPTCTGYRCDICQVGCDWDQRESFCAQTFLASPHHRMIHIPGGDRW